MIFRLVAALFAFGVVLFAGCASSSRDVRGAQPAQEPPATMTTTAENTAPAPAAPVVVTPDPAPVAHKKPAPARGKNAAPATPVLKPGEYALMVESEPSGATVVVNGKPCGKTPCRVVLQANGRGFLREQVSIKVRFIAANETQSSQTVEEVLTTFDKVPTAIRFTTAGATRIVR
jgi:hypothetical protein